MKLKELNLTPFICMTYADLGCETPLLEPDLEPAAYLCFRNMVALLANEIIDMRTDPNKGEAMKKRYAEIELALGPPMVAEVKYWVSQWWPPYCLICGSEKELGPEGTDDQLEVYQAGGGSADWMHRSCTVKFHLWCKDGPRAKGPHPIPPLEVVDAAWRKKHPGELASVFYGHDRNAEEHQG